MTQETYVDQTTQFECNDDLFNIYRASGGILSRETHNSALVARMRCSVSTFNRQSISQAEHLARSGDFPIDDDTRIVYGYLRTRELDIEKPRKFTDLEILAEALRGYLRRKRELDIKSEHVNPWALTDQEILAEALLIQGRLEDHTKFVEAHPNIFDRPISKR